MRTVPLALALLLAMPVAAQAHAFLDRAVPGAGSDTKGSPPALTLTFSEAIEPLFSQVTIQSADGQPISVPAFTRSADGRTLTIPLPNLPPGDYRVSWRVTSIDTHRTEGRFTFTVRP